MDLIKLVDSLSKLFIELSVLTQKSVLELVVNSNFIDSTLELVLKLLRSATSPDRLYVVEFRNFKLGLERLAKITEVDSLFICSHFIFDILDLVS